MPEFDPSDYFSPSTPSAPGLEHIAAPPVASRRIYLPVPVKYALAVLLGIAWAAFSVWLSLPWVDSLGRIIGRPAAWFVIAFIAYVPGFMNAFLATTILLDRRPARRLLDHYPPLTILVACYNEADAIADTVRSLAGQDYLGECEILILDDGSSDDTVAQVHAAIARFPARRNHRFHVVTHERNRGKASVLNDGLARAQHAIVLTVDADCWVYEDAVRHLVERYMADPPGTRAVAGCVLARNSRFNWLTRMQEWDYFHGIAAVKRMQSMYHGTLVAQGAFSLYDRDTLREVGGWPQCVGEDIVASWALLARGYRIGYCEDAIAFTHVPVKLAQFARQRQRWSRGLIEAFLTHPGLLVKPRMTVLFIWWNLLFLPLDLVYTFAFIPGLVLALFGIYWLAGPMTLLVLPLAVLWNMVIFRVQHRMFKRQDLNVRRNTAGFVLYVFVYTMLLQPICVWGYATELLGVRKRWGTK
ncbi:glycosyltransferase [Agrilutibacter solisilvae]|uniref:glycosyltransferase n=1 Tax=Agrilutibacter solisilvae TaxID=2763317 RepID=UPI001FD6BFB3|nr:glycosyltransferase [Lysobacter solisilvae]